MPSMSRLLAVTTITLASIATLSAGAVQAQEMKPVISLATARAIADGCEAKSKAEGWKMVIAVVDDGANLKYYSRMDGSFLVSVEIARLKAETSARVPLPSRKWGEFSTMIKGLDLVPGMISFAGGLPIMAGGKHIGGVGVSGGSADQDEVCAQAGLDAAKDLLK